MIAHACERSNADGLLIHPVIGPGGRGAYTSEAIIRAYERLVTARVPNALLAAFSTYPRYCGVREDVFAALCRKNFGCTHIVLGGSEPERARAVRAMFERLGNVGITPVFFDPVCYSPENDATVESASPNGAKPLSADAVLEFLGRGEDVPPWCMSDDVRETLATMRAEGARVVDL